MWAYVEVVEERDTWGEPSTEAGFASEVLAELSRRLVVGQVADASPVGLS